MCAMAHSKQWKFEKASSISTLSEVCDGSFWTMSFNIVLNNGAEVMRAWYISLPVNDIYWWWLYIALYDVCHCSFSVNNSRLYKWTALRVRCVTVHSKYWKRCCASSLQWSDVCCISFQYDCLNYGIWCVAWLALGEVRIAPFATCINNT